MIDNDVKIATIKTLTGYFLPGGGIRDGETYDECHQREFIEETGYKIIIEKYIGKASLYHVSKKEQYTLNISFF